MIMMRHIGANEINYLYPYVDWRCKYQYDNML